MNNDNNIAQTRNASHSIAFALIGGDYVVSCFPVVDGEVDTDREVFVRTFDDAGVAKRVYQAQSALLAMKARDFDTEIDWVYRCVSSLGSCLYREVPNEARILRSAMQALQISALKRRDAGREARKAQALERAARVLAERETDLPAQIAAEAERRAAKGQP